MLPILKALEYNVRRVERVHVSWYVMLDQKKVLVLLNILGINGFYSSAKYQNVLGEKKN